MDDFLSAVGVQAMRYAIRSGIALTSSYAIGQCSRLLKSVEDKDLHSELRSLQTLLHGKIKVISPAIDLIEFKSGRGNVFLASALPLARSLQERIASLGHDIEAVAVNEEKDHIAATESPRKLPADHKALKKVIADIRRLLEEIDREIPLLQLAISASGESLSTSLPSGISPSRLLQASTLLIIGDTQFVQDPTRTTQIGPPFILSLYMLDQSHVSTVSASNPDNATSTGPHMELAHPKDEKSETGAYGLGENERKPIWQEVIHKARVRLCRSALSIANEGPVSEGARRGAHPGSTGEYSYHLEVIEDLDDGRAHEDAEIAQAYDGILKSNIRELVPIRQISRIFYTDAGRLLNIGNGPDGAGNPILLLKRATSAQPPGADYGHEVAGGTIEFRKDSEPHATSISSAQAAIDRQLYEEAGRVKDKMSYHPSFPKHLDPEWLAFEVYEEDIHGAETTESDDDDDDVGDSDLRSGIGSPAQKRASHGRKSLDSGMLSQIENISLRPSESPGKSSKTKATDAEIGRWDSSTETQDFGSRSPFGAIQTSLSLIEMLIRLAGLQEHQQASHLSTPDHILTFFLEESSTTGLTGEAKWEARREAEKRIGFDPFTDSPSK